MANPTDPATELTLQKVLSALQSAFPGLRPLAAGSDNGGSRGPEAVANRARAAQEKSRTTAILATTVALNKLTGATNATATSMTGFRGKVEKAGLGLVNFAGSINKTLESLSLTRSQLKKASSEKGTQRTTGLGEGAQKFGDTLDKSINPKLRDFRANIDQTSKFLLDMVRELRAELRTGQPAGKTRTAPKAQQATVTQRPRVTAEEHAIDTAEKLKRGIITTHVGGLKPLTPTMHATVAAHTAEAGAAPVAAPPVEPPTPQATPEAGTPFSFLKSLKIAALELGVLSTASKVLDEMFKTLASQGLGTYQNYVELSWSAIKAGMSLQDYTKLLKDNMAVVSRSSSFADFQLKLKAGTDTLAKFGVFGADAEHAAATMATTFTQAGVPQSQLSEAVRKQADLFGYLQKTTMMTAEEFANLTKAIGEDSQVRVETLALAPAERAQRLSDITKQAAYGAQIGLSTTEQAAYTQAVLAARKSTVKERFNQAGRLTQAASMVGMGAGEVQELRTLAMNKYKTGAETERFNELQGTLAQGLERMEQSGQPGSQYQADTIRESLSTSGVNLDVAAAVKAAKESGPQVNNQVGKELSGPEQFLGKTLAGAIGLMQNHVVQAIAGAAGVLGLQLMTLGRIERLLGGKGLFGGLMEKFTGKKGGPTGTVGKVAGAAEEWTTSLGANGAGGEVKNAAKKTWRERLFGSKGAAGAAADELSGIKGAGAAAETGKATGIMGKAAGVGGKALGLLGKLAGPLAAGVAIVGGIADYQNAAEAAKPENGGTGDVGEKKGEAIGEGIGAVAGTAIGLALAPFTLGLSELIAPFVGGFLGKMIGGFVGSESATEKNTRILKENTDELIKGRRETAGSEVISSNNLGSLGANVLQTANAFRPPTAEEIQKYSDSKKTPEQRAKEKADADAAKAQAQASSDVTDSTVDFSNAMSGVFSQADMASAAGVKVGNIVPTPTMQTENMVATPANIVPTPTMQTENMVDTPANIVPTPTMQTENMVATPANTGVGLIATPASITPTSVNPGTVNKDDAAKAAATAATAAISTANAGVPTPQDPVTLLTQILTVLQNSLMAENQQVDLVSQILRANAMMPTLPDNQQMARRVIAQ